MPKTSLTETQRVSGLKPGDYELGSLESRAAARAMYDAQAIEESSNRILFGERAGGEEVRLLMGERGQVLRTEARRGNEWVRVEDAPKPSRITRQMVQVGNVLLIGGPPPDEAFKTATQISPSEEPRRVSKGF